MYNEINVHKNTLYNYSSTVINNSSILECRQLFNIGFVILVVVAALVVIYYYSGTCPSGDSGDGDGIGIGSVTGSSRINGAGSSSVSSSCADNSHGNAPCSGVGNWCW